MSLLRHRAKSLKFATPEYAGSAGAGSVVDTYTVTLGSAPILGELIIITVAGAQNRTITDINGAGVGAWQSGTEEALAYAWKISDGTEGTSYVVTMNGNQSGVCLVHRFKNINNIVPTIDSQTFTTALTVTSPTYTLSTPGLIIVCLYTITSNSTWTNIPSGFTNEFPNNFNRLVFKARPLSETGTATWSSASNSNTGAIVYFLFTANRRS